MGAFDRFCRHCGSSIVDRQCECHGKKWAALRACAYCGAYSVMPEQCPCNNDRGRYRTYQLPAPPIARIEAQRGETEGLDGEAAKAGLAPNNDANPLNTGD